MSTISNINELPASAEVDIPQSSLRVLALPLSLLLGGVILCLCAFAMPTDVGTESAAIVTSKPVSIEDVQLGWRVVGENPLGPEDDASEPNEQSWKKVVLQHRSEEGTLVEIEFLRPNAWFEKWRAEVGRTIDLSLSEPGKSGVAKVIAIDACPEIKPGDGPVVTGLFRHRCKAGELVRVTLEADIPPIVGTYNHPFWSETRREFVNAEDLGTGEKLRCIDGSFAQVASVERVSGLKPVFNLETHNQHVYSVGNAGLLVHNMCGRDNDLPIVNSKANQDSQIRDNIGRRLNSGQVSDKQARKAGLSDGDISDARRRGQENSSKKNSNPLIETNGKSTQGTRNSLRTGDEETIIDAIVQEDGLNDARVLDLLRRRDFRNEK